MIRFVFILLFGLLIACDTERTISLPEHDYFLKFYGTEGEQTGVDFVLTADNAIVMVGNSKREATANQMIYVVKVDLNGNVIWEKIIGVSDKNNAVKDIELTSNGDLVIAGETEIAVGNRDVFIAILDVGSGSESNSVVYELNNHGGGDEIVNSISVVNASLKHPAGYIISGSTTDVPGNLPNDRDGMTIRFTEDIEIPDSTWNQRTGAGATQEVLVKTIQIDSDLLYAFGYTTKDLGFSNDYKYWIFKLNDNGGTTNDANDLLDLLGEPNENEFLKSVTDVNISDPFYKGFLLQGVAVDASGNTKSYTVKLKRDLGFTENDIYGETEFPLGSNLTDRGMASFHNTVNNDYLVLTTRNLASDLAEGLALYKLDRENQPVWGPQVFGGENFDEAGAVLQLPNGKIMVLGTMTLGEGGQDSQKKMALLKLNSEGKLLR